MNNAQTGNRNNEDPKGVTHIGQVNQGSDGVQVSDDAQVRVTMMTGARHNEQPGDLEPGEGAHVTVVYLNIKLLSNAETGHRLLPYGPFWLRQDCLHPSV